MKNSISYDYSSKISYFILSQMEMCEGCNWYISFQDLVILSHVRTTESAQLNEIHFHVNVQRIIKEKPAKVCYIYGYTYIWRGGETTRE